jgi:hypothetical protein
MKHTRITIVVIFLALVGIAKGFATNMAEDSPCFLLAPANFKAVFTGPNFVYLTWTPTPTSDTYRIKTYRATDNQLISSVDIVGSIGFKLLFVPTDKIHYCEIRGVCSNGFESGFFAQSNIFTAHTLDLLSIGYAPAPNNYSCTISHGSQGCEISTTEISDFALIDEETETVLKTFNVRQEAVKKHYQVLNGSSTPGADFTIQLDGQNPDYFGGYEYSMVAKKGGIIASFRVETHYNPNYSELYVTSLADGYDIVKYESNGFSTEPSTDQRSAHNSNSGNLFEVWPNPATSACTLQLSNSASANSVLQIIHVNGQTMSTAVIPEGSSQYEADIAALPVGLYLLRVESNGIIQTRKLVITQ